MADEEYQTFKILLLGDLCVGKTSILLKYVENKFEESILSTIGVDYMDKIINYGHEKVKLQIWDTSGQEKFKSIATNFLRTTDGAFLVFDITQRITFDNIKKWLNDVKENNEEVKIIILGNKSDLKDNREVKQDYINTFLEKNNFKYFETSAKNGTYIEEAFKAMADLLMENETREKINNKRKRGNSILSKNSVISTDEKKKSCC